MTENNNSSRIMTARLFQKAMLTMFIASLTGGMTAIIDGILVGRFLGASGLAIAGLGSPYYSVASIISGILSIGSTKLCTKAIGKGDREELTGVFSLTMLLGVSLSVLLAVAGFGLPGLFAALFGAKGASPELYAGTQAYLRGLFIGTPAFILYAVLTPLLQLDGDALRPRIASFACAGIDVVGDLLNIFVFHGGIFGMALASSISQWAAFLIVASHFLKKGSFFRFSTRAIRPRMCLPLFNDGLPRAMCMLSRCILPILVNGLLLRLTGGTGVTALSAMINTSFVISAFGTGIGGGMLIMGGMMVCEEDANGLKTVIRTAMTDILAGVSALAVAVFFLAPLLAALFIPQSGEAQQMACTVIRCYAVSLPFLAFNFTSANYFQAVGKNLAANLVNIGIEVAFTAAMAYLLSVPFGVLGVWLAYPVGQMLLSGVIVLRFFLARDKSRTGIEAHMLLPKGFGIPEENRVEQSLRTEEEVAALSERIFAFCRQHGLARRDAYRMALCVEEMAGNVIEHGFSDGPPHNLYARVLIKDGHVTLRLRDDCPRFDLREKVRSWSFDPEHPEQNIGIRMVLKLAEDVSYINTMNTNNLIVRV